MKNWLNMDREIDGALIQDMQLSDSFWLSHLRVYWPPTVEPHDRFPILVPNVRTATLMANQLEVILKCIGSFHIVDCLRPSWSHRWYRNPSQEDKHLTKYIESGVMAVDIRPEEMVTAQAYMKIDRLMDNGEITQGGLGKYGKILHYDTRGRRARWSAVSHNGTLGCIQGTG